MATIDSITDRYKQRSPILHPENQRVDVHTKFLNVNDPGELTAEISSVESFQAMLQDEISAVREAWEDHRQRLANEGRPRPKVMTREFSEKLLPLEAKLKVAELELEFLREKLETAEAQKKEAQSRIKHPRHWGSGQLREGVLVSLGGHRVAPDPEGLLRISDPRSDYNGMPVWKFKSQIVKPMALEFSYRQRQVRKLAKEKGTAFKRPPYPKPGKWNRETDLIEYQGYSNATIKKLKRSDEDK